MASHIGSTVEIHTTMGNYQGVLHMVEQESNGQATRVTLAQVVSLPDKKKLPGAHHFFREDIRNLILLKEKKEVKIVKTDGSDRGKSLLRNKEVPVHLKRLKAIDRQKMFAHRPCRGPETEEVVRPPTSHGQMPCKLPKHANMKYTIFYNTGVDFRKAVEDMKKYKMIGLAAEGACLGRTGTLLWLQIALPNECFLFDMKTIGANSALSSGLKEILESPAIQKVIHNCRMLSDYLHHKHEGLKIVNVFDTQVADILVYQNEHKGDLPRFVHSISQVVPVCIDLEVEEVYKARSRAATQAKDQMRFWGGPRPPSAEVVETAMFNVMYLLPLYQHLMDKLFEPLRKGVDVFLANLRDCSDHQHQMRKENNHLVPNEFADLARLNLRDGPRFVENDHLMPDPHIVFSHDSVPHVADPEFDTRMKQLRSGKNQWLNEQSRRGRVRSKSMDGERRTAAAAGDRDRTSSRSPRTNAQTSPREPPSNPPHDSLLALAANARPKQPEPVTRPAASLITDMHPPTVQDHIQRVLDQPFVSTPSTAAARSQARPRHRPQPSYRASGAESTSSQAPMAERRGFVGPARKADDGEEWGNIPDHKKYFPNEKSRIVDWDCGKMGDSKVRRDGGGDGGCNDSAKNKSSNDASIIKASEDLTTTQEERKDEGFHSRGNSDEDNTKRFDLSLDLGRDLDDGCVSDSCLMTPGRGRMSGGAGVKKPLSPRGPVPGVGRGAALLRLAGLVSPPGVGSQAAPGEEVRRVPRGRAAVLNAYGN